MAKKSAYARAGVDIDEMMTSLEAVKRNIHATNVPGVRSEIGSFGGLFESPGAGALLVASTDGVGTKLTVAAMMGRHDTVGQDLVNHCVNDILVQGARPLFFLDYLGTSRLKGKVFERVIAGLCKACRANGCALLGGETAEMPGLYPPGEYDLVGTIIGTVDRKRVVTGATVRPGDCIIGLPSQGLHTNGYSLARDILFRREKRKVTDRFPGLDRTIGDVLLDVHRSYLKPVMALLETVPVHGMAHITGGGLIDNVPRVLPEGTVAAIDTGTWTVPHVFQYLGKAGRVDREEMYRVFNMGIGYVIIVRAKDAARALGVLRARRAAPIAIGQIEKGRRGVCLR